MFSFVALCSSVALLTAAAAAAAASPPEYLNETVYKDARCSAAQTLRRSRFPLGRCLPGGGGEWKKYACAADGRTFTVATYADARCGGTPTMYYGTAAQCVENMGYTFSNFVCVANMTAAAPDRYTIDFDTDIDGVGVISVNVTRAWAPLGADHLHALVLDGFYDGAAFFRVVGGFVLQFGIAGTPAENAKWSTPIQDDPVVASNTQFTVTYATAGPNTRTTQLFINYKDNANLDAQGFAPLGRVVAGKQYLSRVHDPTPGDSGGVNQTAYEAYGDAWIRTKYPEINFIKKASIR